MFAEIIAVVLAGCVIAAYFERVSLKAAVLAAKADVLLAGTKFLTSLNSKESQVRAKISADVKKIVTDIQKWESAETVSTKEVIAQFEARLRQII